MAANAAGLQPDFGVIATSLNAAAVSVNTAATHLGRCANVPAIAGTQAILDAIQRMETNMTGMETRLVARIDGVETQLSARIDGLSARIDRLERRMVVAESPLEPLHSVLTGNPIPGFPAQLADIDHLTGAQADAVLSELGTTVQGGVREKRKRIRAFCGVRPAV
ncbi:hypothetical protein B0H67DRAFT_554798 [Lasiosphaeris hirsuta]|uniref:Uncharacterized protein n=1 Tax=Lasiosphaeris hirsuta TaxID=260670 RepID=A0AA40DP08_9PEZI|nr:hypothetical protein B0H67DRAFT_554798 [Lasiosphaeris hirsuta]